MPFACRVGLVVGDTRLLPSMPCAAREPFRLSAASFLCRPAEEHGWLTRQLGCCSTRCTASAVLGIPRLIRGLSDAGSIEPSR